MLRKGEGEAAHAVHVCNPSTWEAEAGIRTGLHSEFRNKLGEKRGEEKPRGNGGCFRSL